MYIGIDIGGTHTRVAIGENGFYKDKKDFPTRDLTETLGDIKDAVSDFDTNTAAAGVSVAGPYNFKVGVLSQPPNLQKSWDKQDLPSLFTKELGIPTFVAHDASVAALGEAKYGAGKGRNPVLYYTVSTGIGSGLIVDGKIYHGIFNPEAGHQMLSYEGKSLESLASGTALKQKTGKEPREVEGTLLWDEAMDWIGLGIANSILHFSPEIVVIGGGMTKHRDIFFEPVRKALSKYLKLVTQVEVVPAGLGQDSGLIGALELATQSYNGSGI